jgi:O-antigen ligase
MVAIRRRLSLYIFCSVVGLAPLPFGSVEDLTIAFWVALLGLTTVLAIPSSFSQPQRTVLLLAAILALAWGLVLHEQTSVRPWLGHGLADPIWSKASDLLGVPLPQYITVVRNQPFFAAGAQIAAYLSFVGGFLLGHNHLYAKAILRTFAWSGAMYAAYAIASFIWDPSILLWREKIAYRTVLTGTFINRNTAAIYFATCASVWLLLFMRKIFGPSLRVSADTRLSALLLHDMPPRAVLRLALFVLLMSAVFMTGSRAGSLLFLLIMAGVCVLSLRKRGGGGKALLALIAALGLAGVILLEIVGSGVVARIGSGGLTDAARLSVYRAVLRMVNDHLWLGTGLGTFAWIFPSYRPNDMSAFGVWDRAHSTPLEIAAEQGLPFALLVACGFLLIFYVLIVGVRTRRFGRIYPAAGLLAALLATAHSMIDFSLQIPGFAIVVFSLVGIGTAQSLVSRDIEPTTLPGFNEMRASAR